MRRAPTSMRCLLTDRCALCPGVNRCIEPDGPENADILFIGEAPGKRENQKGRVFIGPSGKEVDGHYLPLAGLRRRDVRFTNAIRCLPSSSGGKLDGSRAADIALLSSCTRFHLFPEIERGRYRLLVPLGGFSGRATCDNLDLDLQHGFPVQTRWGITAFPMWHPARGIHEPKKMLGIREDWQRLRWYLAGKLQVPVDAYPTPDYQEVTDVEEIKDLDDTKPLALDTESTKDRTPHCATYSQTPGTGRLIRAGRLDILGAFQRKLHGWHSYLLVHNWLYDWAVTDSLQLGISNRRVIDTMARVFHLGHLPQGLKALAWRELGMRMEDFEDVVSPHSAWLVTQYYARARQEIWPKPEQILEQDSKTGLWKVKQPQSMNTRLKRFFTDLSKNPEKDVFNMWSKNWIHDQTMIEERLGPWPGLCISHVPFDLMLYYACRDVDALIRLWPRLQHMKAKVRHTSVERWRL